jgi:hypothetical protein
MMTMVHGDRKTTRHLLELEWRLEFIRHNFPLRISTLVIIGLAPLCYTGMGDSAVEKGLFFNPLSLPFRLLSSTY